MPFASSTAATGGTATPARWRGLRRRVVSGLVLAAVTLACAWAGGWPWLALVTLVGLVLAWEWAGLCAGRPALAPDAAGWLGMAATTAGILLGGWVGAGVGLVVLTAGALATGATAAATGAGNGRWRLGGVLYVGLSCLAIVWLRADPAAGRDALLWVLALVWATDIAAYVAGRRLGGPKLAPAISPGKTWSGLAGGVLAAAAVGAAAGLWLSPEGRPGVLAGVSAGLAVIEQMGDLFESAVKRRFGVKDSSAIIPGHGGFLDRVDGLMAVCVAVAALTLAGGRTILAW